jgi:hypothetical protein
MDGLVFAASLSKMTLVLSSLDSFFLSSTNFSKSAGFSPLG